MSLNSQEELWSSGIHCLYTFLESEAKNDKVYKVERAKKLSVIIQTTCSILP